MERDIYPRHEIEERLRRFVLAELYTDSKDPRARSKEWAALLKNTFKTSAIPLYAVYRPDGTVVGSLSFPGGSLDAFAKRMGEFLDRSLEQAR